MKPGVFGGVGGLTPGWARGPERRPEWSAKNTPVLMNTTTGFKFLLEKTRETVIFGPSFTETVKKKKKWAVSP